MASPIPDDWKRKVRAALGSGVRKRVQVRDSSATFRFLAKFPNAFRHQMLDAISAALRGPNVEGERKWMDEPTETYAFFFEYERCPMYAKVGLMPDGMVVIVYSAHEPDPAKKGKL